MAYTIVKSDGTVLTTIADGTINTTSTSLGLPGRNYPGYGQTLDTNFVHMVENFAANTPPANPIRGQLWYNINNSTLYVCPTNGAPNANVWLALTATASGGNTTFGAVTVTGNLSAANISATNDITASNLITSLNLTITGNANIGNASISNANIGTLTTTAITSGSQSTAGTITGVWTANGSGTVSYGGPNANTAAGTSLYVTGGNLVINPASNAGIRTDNLMYANGANIFGGGAAYSNSNVAAYLPTYTGNVGTGATIFVGTTVTTGANTTAGTITGNWTLSAGSRLQATYADLAERFEADETYDPGTVVQLGGTKEITAVKFELSEDVFGVISNSAAYLMNAGAGDDQTHPPVAVSGRVQVKVTGKVEKGQRLVSAGNGIARAAESGEATAFNTIGRALADKTTEGVGTVEAIVIIR
jgi:hypothetical protein